MITALVMLTVERNKINQIGEKLSEIKGISEVYSITGQYDLAAIIRVRDNEKLSELVTEQLLKVEGIVKSETHIAFRVYSRHDLEKMFQVGIDNK